MGAGAGQSLYSIYALPLAAFLPAHYNDLYTQLVGAPFSSLCYKKLTAGRTHMHIVTVAEMRELEARADREYGLTSPILMENAGKSAAEILVQHIRHSRSVSDLEFLILVGPGNNGGDG